MTASVEERLTALEQNVTTLASALGAVEQRMLGVAQSLMEGLGTLDKREEAYRTAGMLEHISDIYPKKKIVLFMGRSYFGDNIKYAFLSFLAKADKDVECYYLPRDEKQHHQLRMANMPCLPRTFGDFQPDDIALMLSAKVLVLDEQYIKPNWRQFAFYSMLHGAKTVQLWHGIAIKQIGLELAARSRLDSQPSAEALVSNGVYDVFVGAAKGFYDIWRRKFEFKHYAPIGQVRDDVLFRDLSAYDALNTDSEALGKICASTRPVFLYAPTFRQHGGMAWFEIARIAEFADYCHKKDYALYVNLHPGEQGVIEQFRAQYPTITFIAPGTDIYPIVKYVSVMITDYSSIVFDFLLLDRPVLFYRPDHQDYIAKSRQLIAEHEDYVCGAVAHDLDGLFKIADEAVATLAAPANDPHQKTRHALRDRLFDQRDGLAGERLWGVVGELLGD